MPEEQKQKILALFESQNLPEHEKEFWLVRLERMTEGARERVCVLFETYPGEIHWLCDIQQRKEKALAGSANHAEWEAILDEEQERFKSLLSKT